MAGVSAFSFEDARARGLAKLRRLVLAREGELDDEGTLALLHALQQSVEPLLDEQLETFFLGYFRRRFQSLEPSGFLAFARAVLNFESAPLSPGLAAELALHLAQRLPESPETTLDHMELLHQIRVSLSRDPDDPSLPRAASALDAGISLYRRALLLMLGKAPPSAALLLRILSVV